jgi:Pyruvate kinase, barrel domain
MTGNRLPTRAECTDVANAIVDGTDCVMLSGECAMGKYPVESVEMLAKIARATENSRRESSGIDGVEYTPATAAEAAGTVVQHICERFLVPPCLCRHSAATLRMISRFKPRVYLKSSQRWFASALAGTKANDRASAIGLASTGVAYARLSPVKDSTERLSKSPIDRCRTTRRHIKYCSSE